jgi:endonuclease YncB( thermonuclease family)
MLRQGPKAILNSNDLTPLAARAINAPDAWPADFGAGRRYFGGKRALPPQWCRIPAFGFTLMMGWWGRALAGVVAAESALICAPFGAAAEDQMPPVAVASHTTRCGGDEIARGSAGRVLDGRTFLLDDGREVRLAAIEVPMVQAPRELNASPEGDEAKSALAGFLAGAQLILRRAEVPSDRYGRIVAYAVAARGDSEQLLQEQLISAGFARVGDRVGSRDCATELLHSENTAREARLGLWARSFYSPLQADHPADILVQRGRFAVVNGTVVSVHESGATVYVNFGRHWSEDFSVTIRKRNEASFAAANLDLKRFAGRRLRIRGWVEARGGAGGGPWHAPWIEAVYPGQIEIADGDERR